MADDADLAELVGQAVQGDRFALGRLLFGHYKAQRLKRGGDWLAAPWPAGSDHNSWLALVDLVAAEADSPSKRLAGHEAVQAMQVAVASLPEEQRAAVALHHLEGQSVESTAAHLERSPGAVRGLLQRARRSLREALGNSSRWFEKKP